MFIKHEGIISGEKVNAHRLNRHLSSFGKHDEFLQQSSKANNFNFIYLVRDPRGLMNSRLRISKVQYKEDGRGPDIAKKLGAHCTKMAENIQFIKSSPFWADRTMVVRYEDIALRPKEFAKKLYNVVNLEYLGLGFDENYTHLFGYSV